MPTFLRPTVVASQHNLLDNAYGYQSKGFVWHNQYLIVIQQYVLIKLRNNIYTSNIFLIPCILIRHLYVLLLMTNPYLQECLFESMKLIRRRKQDLLNENWQQELRTGVSA
jgi:hypothetical protein